MIINCFSDLQDMSYVGESSSPSNIVTKNMPNRACVVLESSTSQMESSWAANLEPDWCMFEHIFAKGKCVDA